MKKSNTGFTIVEVLIVLAIASLIMLVVFLAVPSLRRSHNDLSRKNTAVQLVARLEDYGAQNAHNYTSFSCTVRCTDISDVDSPSNHPIAGTVGVSATAGSGVTYVIGGACGTGSDAGTAVSGTSPTSSYAVLYWSQANRMSQCMDAAGKMTAGVGTSGYAADGSVTQSSWAQNGGNYSTCVNTAGHPCGSYAGNAAYSAYAPTKFNYDLANVAAGTNRITINYKNTMPLPDTYPAFNVNIYFDGVKVLSNQQLPVNTDGSAPGPYVTSINTATAPTNVSVEWTNDWCCGTNANGQAEDANFVLLSLSFAR